MASNLGPIFVELGLDDRVYKQKLSETLTSTEATAKGIETSWRALGTKADATFEAQRRSYENAMTLIKNSANSTAQDIIRAEEAKNAKIISINEQQFGKTKSLMDFHFGEWESGITAISTAYMAASMVISQVVGTIGKAWDLAKIGAEYEEQKGILDNLSTKYGTTSTAIVSAMEKASDGLIANADLMQIALGGVAKGLKPEQLIQLADAAHILGKATGVDATTSLKDLTEALETGRTRALKPYLGTSLDLATAFDGLDSKMTVSERSQAMLSLTLMKAAELQAQQTKEVDSTADKMDRVEASYKNATLALAGYAKGLVAVIYDSLVWNEARQKEERATNLASVAMSEYNLDIDAYSVAKKTQTGATRSFADAVNSEAIATKAIISPYQAQIDKLKEQLKTRKDNEQATKDGVTAAKKAAEEIIAAEKKAAEEEKKNYLQGIDLIAKLTDATTKQTDEGLKAIAEIDKGKQESYLAGVDLINKLQAKTDEATKEQIKQYDDIKAKALDLADKQLNAAKSMYSGMGKYGTEYYDAVKVILEKEAAAREKILLEGVTDTQEADKIKKASAEKLSADLVAEDIKRLKGSKDWKDGVVAYFKEADAQAKTAAENMYEYMKTFATASKTAISDTLFQAIKTGTVDISTIWESFTNTMLKKFTDIIAEMIITGNYKDIAMNFSAAWTAGSTAILNIINKGWDLWNSYSTSAYSGGLIEGYASGGDSPANDTVRAWLSPGEYVVPRSAINAQTLPALEYMRENKSLPRYADGGVVTDPTTSTTPINYGLADFKRGAQDAGVLNSVLEKAAADYMATPEYASTLGVYDAYRIELGGDPLTLLPYYPNPYLMGSGNLGDGMYTQVWRDGQLTKTEADTDQSWFKPTMMAIIKAGTVAMYTAVGNQLGGPPGAAAGAGLSTAFVTWASTGDLTQTLIAAAIAAAIAYYGAARNLAANDYYDPTDSYLGWGDGGDYVSHLYTGMGGLDTTPLATYATSAATSSSYDAALDWALKHGTSFAKDYIVKNALKYVGNAIGGGDGNDVSYGFDSAEGDLSWLYNDMRDIAPKRDSVSFPLVSARSGLDYVPRDNFRANLHEGEAVLNKKAAASWRGEGGAELKELMEKIEAGLYSIAKNTAKSAKILDRFDGDGIPSTRTV